MYKKIIASTFRINSYAENFTIVVIAINGVKYKRFTTTIITVIADSQDNRGRPVNWKEVFIGNSDIDRY
jgi:hypothetical protein